MLTREPRIIYLNVITMGKVRKVCSNNGCRQNVIPQDKRRENSGSIYCSPFQGHSVGCGTIFLFLAGNVVCALERMWFTEILRVLATSSEMKDRTVFFREYRELSAARMHRSAMQVCVSHWVIVLYRMKHV